MKKRILSLVLMISMVVMLLLPTTVFANANVIERTLDIVYNGPSKICVEQDFTFSYTIPDNYRSSSSFVYIDFDVDGRLLDFYPSDVSRNGQTFTVTVKSERLKSRAGNSSSCVVYMGADHNSGWEYGTGYIRVAIEIGHIDVDKDHVCDCEECRATISTCSGGTATCKGKAVCDYCGKPYGELNSSNHVGGTEVRNAKEATCTEDGYTGDTYCKGCDTKLQDGKPVAKLGHTDANKDHICDVETCKATISTCSGGTAICMKKAVCEYCGKEYGEVDPHNHVNVKHVARKEATKYSKGNIAYWYCKDCGKYYSDEALTKEITKNKTVIPALTESPKTGDESHVAAALFVTASTGAALTFLLLANKKRDKYQAR